MFLMSTHAVGRDSRVYLEWLGHSKLNPLRLLIHASILDLFAGWIAVNCMLDDSDAAVPLILGIPNSPVGPNNIVGVPSVGLEL